MRRDLGLVERKGKGRAAVVEVVLVFAVTHLAYRALKHFTVREC